MTLFDEWQAMNEREVREYLAYLDEQPARSPTEYHPGHMRDITWDATFTMRERGVMWVRGF